MEGLGTWGLGFIDVKLRIRGLETWLRGAQPRKSQLLLAQIPNPSLIYIATLIEEFSCIYVYYAYHVN